MNKIININDWREEHMTRLEYEARKEWLGGYLSAVRMMDELTGELMELEMAYGAGIARYGDHPHGGGVSDGTDRIISNMERRDALRDSIGEAYKKIGRQRAEIEACLDAMPVGKSREVLYLRYVRGYEFERIALKMNYCARQVQNYHSRAIARIKPPAQSLKKIKMELNRRNPGWAKEEMKIA